MESYHTHLSVCWSRITRAIYVLRSVVDQHVHSLLRIRPDTNLKSVTSKYNFLLFHFAFSMIKSWRIWNSECQFKQSFPIWFGFHAVYFNNAREMVSLNAKTKNGAHALCAINLKSLRLIHNVVENSNIIARHHCGFDYCFGWMRYTYTHVHVVYTSH